MSHGENAQHARLDRMRAELRTLVTSSHHVYEKRPEYGYEMRSCLFVRHLDGTAANYVESDTLQGAIACYQSAIHDARRISGHPKPLMEVLGDDADV